MGTLLSIFFGLLSLWFVWVPVVAILIYMAMQNYKKAEELGVNNAAATRASFCK